jgi:hypothetical protein
VLEGAHVQAVLERVLGLMFERTLITRGQQRALEPRRPRART